MNPTRILTVLSSVALIFGGMIMDQVIIVLIGLGLLIYPLFTRSHNIKKNETQAHELINKHLRTQEFIEDKLLLANDFRTAIGINKDNKNVILLTRNKLDEEFKSKIISFEDIIEVKIKKNHETLTKTSRGSQVAGAAVGGLAFGSVGSLAGALSANKTSSNITKRLSLELVISDLDFPSFESVFINMENGIQENSESFNNLTKDLDYWYRLFTVILHQNKLNIANT
jgi:hypothetical protein